MCPQQRRATTAEGETTAEGPNEGEDEASKTPQQQPGNGGDNDPWAGDGGASPVGLAGSDDDDPWADVVPAGQQFPRS